jgi:hypothetical protein
MKTSAFDPSSDNSSLRAISLKLFGDQAYLVAMDPRELILLKENARFMKKHQFRQLVENLKNDQRLSSVPLCHQLEGGLEVLSGNHRVQAAIEAKLPHILVMVLNVPLDQGQRLAIQLSHNAISGEDDPQILASLWSRIDDIQARLYAGLDSQETQELQPVKLVNFSAPSISSKVVGFAFVQEDFEHLTEVLSRLEAAPNSTYAAPLALWDRFFAALQKTRQLKNVKNGALALNNMLDMLEAQFDKEAEEQKQ